MGKSSGWLIVATEGVTIDGRTITANWIKEMAESYSLDEYTALIWPEHSRSSWGAFNGKNWGTVDELKSEKRAGKLRLFAKITANQYLIKANADGQKLFTSIEPSIDYRGTGKAYLTGLAVTDSPASSGTTRLKFSRFEREYSELEPFIIINEEENNLTIDEIKAAFAEQLQPMHDRLNELDNKFSAIEKKSEEQEAVTNEQGEESPTDGIEAAQFSEMVKEVFQPLVQKMDELDTKFNALLEEKPGQRPTGTGASATGATFL